MPDFYARAIVPNVTPLSPDEEQQFQQWAHVNQITDVDHPNSHYDYRGYWKMTGGAPRQPGLMSSHNDVVGPHGHLPDTFKQPTHPTFSQESQYSRGPSEGGMWVPGGDDTFLQQPKMAHEPYTPPQEPKRSFDIFKNVRRGHEQLEQPGHERDKAVWNAVTAPLEGAKQAVRGAASLLHQPMGDIQLDRHDPETPVSGRPVARAASDIIGGGMQASIPLLPAALARAPVQVGAGLVGGTAAAEVARAAGEKLGIPSEYVDLASHFFGLLGGVTAAHVTESPELQGKVLSMAQDLYDHVRTAGDETGAVRLRTGGPLLTDKEAADHLSRAPVENVSGRLLVSPRILGAKGRNFTPAEPGRILTPTLEAAREDPEYFAKLAAHARQSPMLKPREQRLSDEGVVSAWADRGAENIDALFDMAHPGVRARGGRWYPGGHDIGDTIAQNAGVPNNAGVGVVARLSPGTEWDMNLSNAERVGRWWKEFTGTRQEYTQDHFNQFADSLRQSSEEWIKSKKLTGAKLAKYQARTAKRIADARQYIGFPWNELPYEQRAQLLRAHSEMNESQLFPRYAPEGHIVMPEALGVDGKKLTMKWQSYDNLARALAMLDNPDDAAISFLLGKGHKIRSFYNNLSVPKDPRSLTADVHNVAGTQLRPLGGKQPEVKAVTGNTPGSAQTGILGTYPLYQEATTRAAEARGIIPNKAQSIPWDTTRGLFSPSQRSSSSFRAMANQIWNDYQRGKISLHAAQGQLHDLAGGVTAPAWTQYPDKPTGKK